MLWSTKRVAEEKGVTAMTVRNAIARGELAAVEIVGVETRVVAHGISPDDAREWEPGRRGRKRPTPDDAGVSA